MNGKARAELLIRRPPNEVFSALVEPASLERYWLAKASAPLSPGAKVRWEFMVPGAVDELTVEGFKADRSLQLRSSDGSLMEWTLKPRGTDTILTVEQGGFDTTTETGVAGLAETVQGYTLVLCALKVLLERRMDSRIVADKAELITEGMSRNP